MPHCDPRRLDGVSRAGRARRRRLLAPALVAIALASAGASAQAATRAVDDARLREPRTASLVRATQAPGGGLSGSRRISPTTAAGSPAGPVAPLAASPPVAGDPGIARASAVLDADVPTAWRAALAPRLEAIRGSTSWASTDGVLRFGSFHLGGGWQHLRSVVTHELGHLVAFRFGSQAFLGAGPAGFPYAGSHPEEMWADCVARALTGNADPSHGLAVCDGAALEFARAFIAAGPAV